MHLPFEMLAQAGGVRLNHVPYGGGGPAVTAVLGGQVEATSSVPSVVAPRIASGEMRALVGTGARRSALLPDVPTAAELGFRDVEFYLWVGLFSQAGVDPAVLGRLRDGVSQAVREPELLRQLQAGGSVIEYLDGQAFRRFLDRDQERVEAAVRRIGRVE